MPNRLTERLFREISGPKRMWTSRESGHNDWPADPGLPRWGEVMDFLDAFGPDRQAVSAGTRKGKSG